jgi:hypothetical protein
VVVTLVLLTVRAARYEPNAPNTTLRKSGVCLDEENVRLQRDATSQLTVGSHTRSDRVRLGLADSIRVWSVVTRV